MINNIHADRCKQPEPKHTLVSHFSRENAISSDYKKELCFQAVAASVKDIRPFSLTEGNGVFDLLYCVWNLGAKVGAISREELLRALPRPTTVSRNVNRLATQCKENIKLKLKEEFDSGTIFSLTIDIWQDKHKRLSYFCITLHYYDRSAMKLVDLILTMCVMEPGRKKDQIYLREIIDDKLVDYGLSELRQCLVFISDRGGNIRAALKYDTRLNCFPHFLHNIVKYGCEVDSVKRLIIECAALVKYFKFTGLNNMLEKSLKSAISTRFNYVFMMLNSIDDQWDAIKAILEQRHEISRLANIDRESIKGLTKLLNSFNIASKITECTYKDTLSHVWIGITEICSMCRVQQNDPIYIKAVKARLLEYIESKFVLHQYHRIATFLHPNYKSLIFCSSDKKLRTIRETKNLMNEMFPSRISLGQTESNSSSRRSSVDSDSSFLSTYYNRNEDGLDDVESYINTQWVSDDNIDVFKWWLEKKNSFPNLHRLALKLHSIPASSMQSERTFSRSGLIISDRRSSLNPQTVEDLILLNKNFGFEVSTYIYDMQLLQSQELLETMTEIYLNFPFGFRNLVRKKVRVTQTI